MQTQTERIEKSKAAYQEIKSKLIIDYAEVAKIADVASEECLRKMSEGCDGVFKDSMYPKIFDSIFNDILKRLKHE